MGNERKKATSKPVPIIEPKKRQNPLPELNPIIELEPEIKKQRAKPCDDVYVKIAMGSNSLENRKISDSIQNGELKLAYYTVENDKGYHYYLKIKK